MLHLEPKCSRSRLAQSSSGRAVLASPLRRPPCGISLQDLSDDAKKDPKVVKIAVSLYGCALQYAHEDLRKDPVVVATAVSQNGLALKFALDDAKKDTWWTRFHDPTTLAWSEWAIWKHVPVHQRFQ